MRPIRRISLETSLFSLGRAFTGGPESILEGGQHGQVITDVQRHAKHSGPGVDGRDPGRQGRRAAGRCSRPSSVLPWSFSEEGAAKKYMPQLQHNMWVVTARSAVLSVITGGGKWVEITAHADPLYQPLIVTAERKFWRCVESMSPLARSGLSPKRRGSRPSALST